MSTERMTPTQLRYLRTIHLMDEAPLSTIPTSTLQALSKRGLVEHDEYYVRLTRAGRRRLSVHLKHSKRVVVEPSAHCVRSLLASMTNAIRRANHVAYHEEDTDEALYQIQLASDTALRLALLMGDILTGRVAISYIEIQHTKRSYDSNHIPLTIEVVPLADGTHTHLSVYARTDTGEAIWMQDEENATDAYEAARSLASAFKVPVFLEKKQVEGTPHA